VGSWQYANPVRVVFGRGAFARVADAVQGRSYCLVTYSSPQVFRDLGQRLAQLAGPPALVIDNVAANPDFLGLTQSCAQYDAAPTKPEIIVALGGGSVLDAAKVLSAADGDFARVRTYLETGKGSLASVPIVAVPTTAGTGSEVTCWATVWDTEAKKKYSLSDPAFYPIQAIVDPELTVAAPRALTVSTGLDALSHALESIWNVNANPASSALAVQAARTVMETLPRLASDLGNIELREAMARAATLAGLAFSNTRTALAHSLSYHLTLHHGVPHGIACSFSLPMVMRAVVGCDPACDDALRAIFGTDLAAGVARLERLLEDLGVSTRASDHGVAEADWTGLIDHALAGERGKNFIGRRPAAAAE
jgi:phosphonate metabolism-associated iron-containing alcohol dehydrogenase